jgi:hypothetical protein
MLEACGKIGIRKWKVENVRKRPENGRRKIEDREGGQRGEGSVQR